MMKNTKSIKHTLYKKNKKLAKEWHPTKNAPLTPKDVTSGSGKKVWWMCRKGHEWEAIICSRSKGNGCPYCAGQKVSKDNCLQEVNPKLAGEWYPIKNFPLTPKDVAPGSRKRVWWKCRKGHEWEAVISNRNYGTGCPYCAGRKVSKENCLQTINPKFAREWHPTKNALLTSKDVTASSGKKVWWMCRKNRGHEWEAVISNRNNGTGCPYCAGRKVSKDNCLQTVSPWLAREWHPTKNALLTSKDVTASSGKKVWWICRENRGHEWLTRVANRSIGKGCPYCSGRKASKENCLQTVSPGLAREWHPTKNGLLRPNDVVPGSHKKVWWMCGRGHEWEEIIADRYRGSGCLYCWFQKKIDNHNVMNSIRINSNA